MRAPRLPDLRRDADARPPPPLARIGWFVAFWTAGLLVTAAVAYGLRLIIFL